MNRTRNALTAATFAIGCIETLFACGGTTGAPPASDADAPEGSAPDGSIVADDGSSFDSTADGPRDSGTDARPDAPAAEAGSDASMALDSGAPDAALVCDGGSHVCQGPSGPFCAVDTSPDTCGSSCMACYAPANGAATCDGTACGYTCNSGYGVCAGGCCLCDPTGPCVLALDQSNAVAIAVDEANVYWTTQIPGGLGSIAQAPVAGGPALSLYAVTYQSPNAIAVSSGDVYFDTFDVASDIGHVMKVAIGGGTPGTLWTGFLADWPTALALAGGKAYFQDYQPTIVTLEGGPAGTADVSSVPLDGGPSSGLAFDQPETDFSAMQVTGAAIAVGGTAVYFTDGLSGDVREVPVGGGAVTTFAAAQYATALATDATNVYWTTSPGSSGGAVLQESLGGGSPVTLASNLDDPDAIAVDGVNVYVATGAGGSGMVMSIPIGGGTATTLATGQSEPVAIAVNSTRVFWVTYGDGKIQSVPK